MKPFKYQYNDERALIVGTLILFCGLSYAAYRLFGG